jgi:hypothetical protein
VKEAGSEAAGRRSYRSGNPRNQITCFRSSRKRIGFEPQRASCCCRFDPDILRSRNFVAMPVHIAMVAAA